MRAYASLSLTLGDGRPARVGRFPRPGVGVVVLDLGPAVQWQVFGSADALRALSRAALAAAEHLDGTSG